MIEDWINILEERRYDPEAMEDIWATHHLCETILNKVSRS
jgi:virulence factor